MEKVVTTGWVRKGLTGKNVWNYADRLNVVKSESDAITWPDNHFPLKRVRVTIEEIEEQGC